MSDDNRVPYEAFHAERMRMIEARQRAQQRTDHLVTAGAAGALVLSITFMETIAPAPSTETRWLLLLSWSMLIASLTASLIGSYMSHAAFDDAIEEMDASYQAGRPYDLKSRAELAARAASALSGVSLLVGVAALAVFALSNVEFSDEPGRSTEAAAPAAASASSTSGLGEAQRRDPVAPGASAATDQAEQVER